MAFVWEMDSLYTPKLFAFSSNNWGTDLAPQAILDASSQPANAGVTEGWSSGSDFYLLVGASVGGGSSTVTRLSCQ